MEGLRACVAFLLIFNGSEVAAKWTERYVIRHLRSVMTCVLLLGKFGRNPSDCGVAEESSWFHIFPCSNGKGVDGAAVSALCIVTDSNLRATKFPHQIEGTCEHPCIRIVSSFVRNDV